MQEAVRLGSKKIFCRLSRFVESYRFLSRFVFDRETLAVFFCVKSI
jgi:hypothetical protein